MTKTLEFYAYPTNQTEKKYFCRMYQVNPENIELSVFTAPKTAEYYNIPVKKKDGFTWKCYKKYVRKVEYCAENNGGKCPYKCRVCDGLCNNCPLNIQPGDKIQTEISYTPRLVLTYEEMNALENRCLPPCYD